MRQTRLCRYMRTKTNDDLRVQPCERARTGVLETQRACVRACGGCLMRVPNARDAVCVRVAASMCGRGYPLRLRDSAQAVLDLEANRRKAFQGFQGLGTRVSCFSCRYMCRSSIFLHMQCDFIAILLAGDARSFCLSGVFETWSSYKRAHCPWFQRST